MGKAEAAFIPPPDFGLGVAEELASLEHALDFGALQAEIAELKKQVADAKQLAADRLAECKRYWLIDELNKGLRAQLAEAQNALLLTRAHYTRGENMTLYDQQKHPKLREVVAKWLRSFKLDHEDTLPWHKTSAETRTYWLDDADQLLALLREHGMVQLADFSEPGEWEMKPVRIERP